MGEPASPRGTWPPPKRQRKSSLKLPATHVPFNMPLFQRLWNRKYLLNQPFQPEWSSSMGPTGNYLLKSDTINGISHLRNLPQSTQMQWDLYIIQGSPVFFSTLHNLLSLYLSGALSPSCRYPPYDLLLMLFSFFPLLLTYILSLRFLAFGCCLALNVSPFFVFLPFHFGLVFFFKTNI